MFTSKNKQVSDKHITSSNDYKVDKLTSDSLDVSIRYATIISGVTVVATLLVTQLLGIALQVSVIISGIVGLVTFILAFSKGVELSRLEQVSFSATYDSDNETLQQTATIPQINRVEIGHTLQGDCGYDKWVLDTLDVELQALQKLSRAVISGEAFNRVTCQESGISQTKWETFKDTMIKLGYVNDNGNGSKKRYVTTSKGLATFRYLATYSPTLAIGSEND